MSWCKRYAAPTGTNIRRVAPHLSHSTDKYSNGQLIQKHNSDLRTQINKYTTGFQNNNNDNGDNITMFVHNFMNRIGEQKTTCNQT